MNVKLRLIVGALILAVPLTAVLVMHKSSSPPAVTARPGAEGPGVEGAGVEGAGVEEENPTPFQEDWTADMEAFREKRLQRAGMDGPPEFEATAVPGWRIWGRATRPGWVPLRDVRIVFRLFDGQDLGDPVEPVFTDEDGRYALVFPAPDTVERYTPERPLPMKLKGWAFAKGFHPRYDSLVYLPHPGAETDPLRLDFLLVQGKCILGVAESGVGNPARDADVFLLEPGKPWRRSAETGTDGAYTIPIKGAGPYLVTAVAFGEGIAPVVSTGPASSPETVVPPLVLRDFGSIAGMVVYAGGSPIDRLEIQACPASLVNAPAREIDAIVQGVQELDGIRPEKEGFEGLPFGTALTGPDGGFHVAGLKAGAYFLRFPGLRTEEERSRTLCETGDKDVRPALDIYHVKVTLRDAQRLLIPEVLLHCEMEGIDDKVYVTRGETVLQVKPGPLYLYATTSDRLYGEVEAVIREGHHASELELILE